MCNFLSKIIFICYFFILATFEFEVWKNNAKIYLYVYMIFLEIIYPLNSYIYFNYF